jgi:hypothetical protein
MTICAQRYQVALVIGSHLAAELDVMDLQVSLTAAPLTPPVIPL